MPTDKGSSEKWEELVRALGPFVLYSQWWYAWENLDFVAHEFQVRIISGVAHYSLFGLVEMWFHYHIFCGSSGLEAPRALWIMSIARWSLLLLGRVYLISISLTGSVSLIFLSRLRIQKLHCRKPFSRSSILAWASSKWERSSSLAFWVNLWIVVQFQLDIIQLLD